LLKAWRNITYAKRTRPKSNTPEEEPVFGTSPVSLNSKRVAPQHTPAGLAT